MAIDLRGIIEFVKAAVEMWALYSQQLAIKCVHSHLNGEPLDLFSADRHRSVRCLCLNIYGRSEVPDAKKGRLDAEKASSYQLYHLC